MKKIKINSTVIKNATGKALLIIAVCLMIINLSNAQEPVLLKDINTTGDTYISNLLTLNGKTIFVADDGIHGYEIWSTDGTTGGTQMVKDINANPGASGLGSNLSEVFKGKVYFSGYGGLGNQEDYELWVTNGTASGTKRFKDLNPGKTQSVWGPHEFTVAGSKLFFVGYGGINNEAVLFVSDGTPAGTVSLGVTAYNLFAYGDKLIFSGHDDVNGDEDIFIWENGVISPLVDINPNPGFASEPHDFIIYNGLLYFTEVQITPFLGRELWVTDGTTGGTHIVKDIITNAGSLTGNELSGFTIYNDKLFFAADPDGFGGNGSQIWTSDGTEAGTTLFKDMLGNGFKVFDNQLFFSGSNVGFPDQELWVSDGTVLGTTLFKDINTNPGEYSNPSGFQVLGDKMYFAVNVDNTTNQRKIFETDGTPGNTFVCEPAIIQNAAYFSSPIGVSKNKLFVTGNYDASIGYETYVITNISGLKWTGTVSTNWFDKRNWNNNEVPAKDDDIKIPAGCPRYPIITTGTAYCREIEIQTGGTLSMTGGTLNVYGEITATNANMFVLTGGTMVLYHGCAFPHGMVFYNLSLIALNNDLSDNTYELTNDFVSVIGNLVLKGSPTGTDKFVPYIKLVEEQYLDLYENLTIYQGHIGMPSDILPLSDNTKLASLIFNSLSTQTVKLYNNTGDQNVPLSQFFCDISIYSQVKFVNTGLPIECYNLFIYQDFDLAGNEWNIRGKIVYSDGSTVKKITNSKPGSGKIVIFNSNEFRHDQDVQWLNIDKLRYFESYNFYSVPNENDTVVLLNALVADTVKVSGYLNLNGYDLKIGSTTKSTGYLECGLVTSTVTEGTISLLGNNACPRYHLVAEYINNLTLNNPSGVELNNYELPVTHPSYGHMYLYGTARLTKGNFDLKQSQIFISPDLLFNENSGRIIETPGNTFTNSVNNPGQDFFIVKDTLVSTGCSNLNVGGLGFFVTCSNPLDDFTILRIPTTVNGLNGGSSINRVFTVSNPNAGININAQIKLKYDDSELQGINESNLTIFRHSDNEPNGVWNIIPSTVNTTANTVTANAGLSQIDYSTSGPSGVTFYTLASITSPLKNENELSNQSESNTTKVLVYPNPFNNKLNAQFNSEVAEAATLQLIDLTGKQMHIEAVQLVAGSNDISLCCIEKLPAGIYFLRITSSKTNSIVKVVKD